MPDQLLGGGEGRIPPVAVDLAEVARARDVATRLGDQRRQVLALVPQRVVLGRGDQRRWQRAEPLGEPAEVTLSRSSRLEDALRAGAPRSEVDVPAGLEGS